MDLGCLRKAGILNSSVLTLHAEEKGKNLELSSVMNHESRNQKCPCPGGRGSRQESFPSEETWDKSILESSPVKLCYKATPLGVLWNINILKFSIFLHVLRWRTSNWEELSLKNNLVKNPNSPALFKKKKNPATEREKEEGKKNKIKRLVHAVTV